MGVCDFCDDYDYGIKQVAGNDDYDYGIKQAGNDDYDYDTTTRADIVFFDSLLKGEVPPNTGGGRVFLPRCSTWSSGHTG